MLFDIENLPGGIALVRMRGALVRASLRASIGALSDRLIAAQSTAILFDMTHVRGANMAGMTALIDIFKSRLPVPLAVCGLPALLVEGLRALGLDALLPHHPSIDAALRDPALRPITLTGHRAVVLCAGTGSRARPMTLDVPKPMLDIAGRPVLDHVLDHLSRSGLRDVLLNPGYLGPVITRHLAQSPRWRQSLFMVPEGHYTAQGWQAAPIGSASTLRRMQHEHGAFDRDVVVLCGDALIDTDLPAMMAKHRASRAQITIALQTVAPEAVSKYGIAVTDADGRITGFQEKPRPSEARSCLANVGIYIFAPEVFDLLPERDGLDIATDLIPAVMAAGGCVTGYAEPFQWVDIGCGRDYARALDLVLTGAVHGVHPAARETRPGVFQHETAQISRRASIEGPVYVGPGAEIAAGARIIGPVTIGAGSLVEGGTLLRASHVMPHVHVARGALLDHMIAAGNWAVDHRHATGGGEHAPLDGVTPRCEAGAAMARAV